MKPSTFLHFVKKFGRVELTRGQRVACAISFDGKHPRELFGRDLEMARSIFGDIDEIPEAARPTVVWVKGARIGGTLLCALRVLHLGLTLPLDTLAPGEVAFGIIVAPDLRLARQALRYVTGAIDESPLADLVTATTSDSITLRRDDGKTIVIECLPATRGGSALRGRSTFGVHFSEAAFFRDENYVVNDAELYRAILPRLLLPGAQVLVESTPWIESGLVHSLFHANHGHPAGAIAAHMPTLLVRDQPGIRRIVETETLRDPENAAREFDAQFMPVGSGLFFDPNGIRLSVDSSLALPQPRSSEAVCAVGCDWGFVKDSSAIAVVEQRSGTVRLVYLGEFKPERGKPLDPQAVAEHFATIALRYTCFEIRSDHHYSESIRRAIEPLGVRLTHIPEGNAGKVAAYDHVRSIMNSGRLLLPDHARLLSQLRAVMSKPTSGGNVSITSPRRAGHGDLVSALVCGAWALRLARRTGGRPAGSVTLVDLDDVELGGDDLAIGSVDVGGSVPRRPRPRRAVTLDGDSAITTERIDRDLRQRFDDASRVRLEPDVAAQLASGLGLGRPRG